MNRDQNEGYELSFEISSVFALVCIVAHFPSKREAKQYYETLLSRPRSQSQIQNVEHARHKVILAFTTVPFKIIFHRDASKSFVNWGLKFDTEQEANDWLAATRLHRCFSVTEKALLYHQAEGLKDVQKPITTLQMPPSRHQSPASAAPRRRRSPSEERDLLHEKAYEEKPRDGRPHISIQEPHQQRHRPSPASTTRRKMSPRRHDEAEAWKAHEAGFKDAPRHRAIAYMPSHGRVPRSDPGVHRKRPPPSEKDLKEDKVMAAHRVNENNRRIRRTRKDATIRAGRRSPEQEDRLPKSETIMDRMKRTVFQRKPE